MCEDRKKRTSLWNDIVKTACKSKKKAYKKWLQTKNPSDRELYIVERDRTKQIVAESKRKSWEDFGNKLETLGQAAGKPFWNVIKNFRNGRKREMSSILDNSGKLIVDAKEALGRWQEYFENLLNVSGDSSGNVANFEIVQEENEDGNRITVEEVERVINKLQCHKAAGVDEIRPEMVKYSGKAGLKWLHRIIKLA